MLIRADLSAFLKRDLRSANKPALVIAFLRAMLDPDFRLVAQVRLIQAMIRQGWKWLALLLYFRQKSRHAVDISPWATYGPGLRLMHAYNITIGPTVVIGSSCTIFNGVTLGNSRPDILRNVMPVVGDRCILGTGAKILGGIRIDDDVLIGANVVVRSDVMKGGEAFLEQVAANQVRERVPLRWNHSGSISGIE
jgi:serine O-acetyltransferase